MDFVQDRARSAVDQQKLSAAERLENVARALQAAADSLWAHQEEDLGRRSRVAASKLERISEHLRQSDLTSLVRELGDVGRRRRGTFIAGALVAGILVGRFLRSHEPDDEEWVAA
jgi:hypothetical protein